MKCNNTTLIVLLILVVSCGRRKETSHELKCLLPNGAKYEQLFSTSKFVTPYLFRALPNGNTVFVHDGLCIDVENTTPAIYKLSIERQPCDIHWDNCGICLFSDSIYIYSIDVTGEKEEFIKANKQNIKFEFNIRTGLYYYYKGDSILYYFSYKYHEFIPIYVANEVINDLKIEENDCYLAVGNEVILINRENEIYPLFKANSTINALELGGNGSIFYGTNKLMGYFDNNRNQFTIMQKGTKALQRSGNSLYVIFCDNSSARIDSISSYKMLSDSLLIIKQ
ncbi:hypothetical protein [Bacteroides sp.]